MRNITRIPAFFILLIVLSCVENKEVANCLGNFEYISYNDAKLEAVPERYFPGFSVFDKTNRTLEDGWELELASEKVIFRGEYIDLDSAYVKTGEYISEFGWGFELFNIEEKKYSNFRIACFGEGYVVLSIPSNLNKIKDIKKDEKGRCYLIFRKI